ncbi:MAG: PfkB family carbohydrate kinase [Candidatus Promineifilaceae bacterium]
MGEHVLLVGAILLDVKGKPQAGLEPGVSNPAAIRSTRGGTARNVAENLALLGADVYLISAVGDDLPGKQLLEQTAASGVHVETVQVIKGASTGTYVAVLEEDGSLSVAMDDVRVMAAITPELLETRRDLFADAAMIMMDGSLLPETMAKVVELAQAYDVPLVADPSSTRVAYKLRPYLSHLHLVVPNEREAAELCELEFDENDTDAGLHLARALVKAGVEHAVVTRADFGLNYATDQETGMIPARYSQFVDSTGTGDALTAAIIFGMLNELPDIESMRLGAAAVSLTLQTAETVVPNLSLDMLYEHLIV